MNKAVDERSGVDASTRDARGKPRSGAPSEAPDRLLGAEIEGRYRLEQRLARGAMGCVYVARQHPLDRLVAVKMLDPKGSSDDLEVFEDRFLLEASTLARLQHPNTVRVIDYGHWSGHTFLVMEYVDGHSLRRLQGGGPIPASRMLHIATQICDALQEAHALGLIHRDLKPANVLLTRHAGALDVVKVVDFGLAKDFYGGHDITQAGQVMGTPMYMAPEQIRDEPCDQRTDIYALGVLLYRALTGANPFEKGPAMKVLMAHLKEAPPPFGQVCPGLDLPPALEWVVMRCLEKHPARRFANVMELRKALNACKLALEHPVARDIVLQVEDGLTVLPDEIAETSHASLSLKVPAVVLEAQPAAPVPPPDEVSSLFSAPVAALVLGLVGLTCTTLGVALERFVLP